MIIIIKYRKNIDYNVVHGHNTSNEITQYSTFIDFLFVSRQDIKIITMTFSPHTTNLSRV